MKRLRQLLATDIPFARDDAHRLLPVMIACLIGFAALLLSVAVSINHVIDAHSQNVLGMLQVEVPRTRADDKNMMNALTAELSHTPGVLSVTVLSTTQMEALLKPWLGTDFSIGELPVPVILDVRTSVDGQKSAVNLEALRRSLMKIDTGIRIDGRGPWVEQVAQATNLLQIIVVVIALLLLICVIGMVVLVAKTNLRLHFKAVSLLHMFGATDEYILRQFQWNSAWLAARGAFIGVIAAGVLFAGAVILSLQWQSPVLPEISMGLAHGAIFLLLPVVTAAIALVVTRRTVSSMLRYMH